MSDHETTLRMDAYYYGFEPTGNRAIDRILSAVACAGKAYHNTSDWTDDKDWQGDQHAPHPEFGGASPVEWIQRAANDAACLAGADALRRGTWQPIASAPKDGTRMLVYRTGWAEHTSACYWDATWREWITVGGNVFTSPTHWMPLPDAPTEPTR